MSVAVRALLGRILSADIGGKLLDYVGAGAAGYGYERLLMYAGGTSIQVPGWKHYGAAALLAVADFLAGEIPGLHGAANGAVGALAAHYQLVKDLEKAAKAAYRRPAGRTLPILAVRA